jgi:hypothetical protein
MKKFLESIVIVLSLSLTLSFVSVAYAGDLNPDEQQLVMNLIKKTLSQQNLFLKDFESLKEQKTPNIMPKHIIFAGKKYNGKQYLKKQIHAFQNMRNHGVRCIKSSFEIMESDCMRLEDDSVDCYVTEVIKSTYATNERPSEIVNSVEEQKIKFNLIQNDLGVWLIKEQVIFGLQPSSPPSNEFSTLNNKDSKFQETFNILIDGFETLDINNATEASLSDTDVVDFDVKASGYYNGNSAALYARQYALHYNPSYRSWSSDCTNFASQSVKAGGWVYDYGWYHDPHNWWYNFLNQTWTWVNAHYFWWFNYYSGRSYLVTSTCNLDLGDIVSADWNRDYYVDHQMIVTKKIGCAI